MLSDSVKNKIKEYYSAYPSDKERISYGGGNEVWGYIYGCMNVECANIKLTWYLKGEADSCGRYAAYDPENNPSAYNGDSTTCTGTIGD
jgi:hypothetical protein